MADRDTLLEAMHRATGRNPQWTEMLLLRNVAPVPALAEEPGDTLEARGFHVVLVDRRGRTTHYAKCRATDDPRAVREAQLLERLAGTAAASCVPGAVVVHGEQLQVIVQEAIPGVRMDVRLRHQSAARAPADAAAVLHAMDRIRAAARTGDAPATLDAGSDLAPSIAILQRAGLATATTSLLHGATQGSWPWRPQHGDLWPGNVIWSAQGPVLLDFEAFGEVNHPMFDAWHLARATCNAQGNGASWLDVLAPRTAADRQWRATLEQVQAGAGFPPADLRAGLAWYVVRMASTLLGRGVPERYSRPYVEDVHRVATLFG